MTPLYLREKDSTPGGNSFRIVLGHSAFDVGYKESVFNVEIFCSNEEAEKFTYGKPYEIIIKEIFNEPQI